jgi:capsular polysaccharide export protein
MTALRVALPPVVHVHGVSPRKVAFLRDFVAPCTLRTVTRGDEIPSSATLLLWGRAELPPGTPANVSVVRVEDGFLRSVGLGADLVRPLSLAFDARGIYFDATIPSDLEDLLQHASIPDELVARATRLRERVVERGVTKYNVGGAPWVRPSMAKRVVLVPGQVETDASLAFGAPHLRRNLDLLKAVRGLESDAYVVYKPHPDVVAGLRQRGDGEESAADFCDEVIVDAPMGALLPVVDAVHVNTSQTGFEALLRGKDVTCHGQPFYAGWGLTRDLAPCARRTRARSLDELVAAALLLYPTYVSARTGERTTAEDALDELDAAKNAAPSLLSRAFERTVRPLLRRLTRRA